MPALLQLHLRSRLNTWLHWIEQRQLQDETRNIQIWGFGVPHIRDFMVILITLAGVCKCDVRCLTCGAQFTNMDELLSRHG